MNGQPIKIVERNAAALIVEIELYTVAVFPVELLSSGALTVELLVIELFVVEMFAVGVPEALLGSSENSENDS